MFHTPENEVFAILITGDHEEIWPVKSKSFKNYLANCFYHLDGKAPNSEAMKTTLMTLEGKGQFDCPEFDVYVRIAQLNNRVYIDLANERWEAIEITSSGWQVIDKPPVRFKRPKGLLELPYPAKSGDVGMLKQFLNCDEQAFKLVVAFMIGSLNPEGPYPILVLNGEQGSAKSTATKYIRECIDPNSTPLRTIPRTERDLAISATNGWLLAYDNLSGMKGWLSDAFCRVSTGGGLATRELYSDSEEKMFNVKRPLILNGITDMVTRHDLADRSLFIILPPIGDSIRVPERELDRDFCNARPMILAGLYTAVAAALKNQRIVYSEMDMLPRLADFAIWVHASESSLPWNKGEFLQIYMNNRENTVESAIDANVVGAAITEWFSSYIKWEGTATDLLQALENITDEKILHEREWPKDATRLSQKLRVISSFLRRSGIEIEFPEAKVGGKRLFRIYRKNSAASVPSSQSQENQDVVTDTLDAMHKDGRNSALKNIELFQ